MGKAPKKRNLADKVRKAKTTQEIKNNPFEVKVNRKKFDVLGRKSKHDVGLPGVSRSKAITKVRDPRDALTKPFEAFWLVTGIITKEFVLQCGTVIHQYNNIIINIPS